jgi:hypothetical protein
MRGDTPMASATAPSQNASLSTVTIAKSAYMPKAKNVIFKALFRARNEWPSPRHLVAHGEDVGLVFVKVSVFADLERARERHNVRVSHDQPALERDDEPRAAERGGRLHRPGTAPIVADGVVETLHHA